jgi:hypothetical protein
MASYELVFRKSVAKDLRRFPNDDVATRAGHSRSPMIVPF